MADRTSHNKCRLFRTLLLPIAAGFMAQIMIGSAAADPDPIPVTIPSHLAITERTVESGDSEAPVLVIIQDAHARYEAQLSMIEILRYLVQYYQLEYVMAEGGSGNIDLSYMRNGVDPRHLQTVALRYLKQGKLSAEEFLDLTLEDQDLKLWGVEDPVLYSQNMQAYLDFYGNQKTALATLETLEKNLSELRTRFYPPALEALSELRRQADQNVSVLFKYLDELTRRAEALGIAAEQTLHMEAWNEIQAKNKALDQSKLELEKKELLRVLTRTLSEEDLYPLHAARMIPGTEGEAAVLETLMRLKNENPDAYGKYSVTEIERALLVIQSLIGTDLEATYAEAEKLYKTIRDQELPDHDAKIVANLSDYAHLVRKLFDIRWEPRDEAEFNNFEPVWKREDLRALLDDKESFQELQAYVKSAVQIYELARQREESIVENSLLFMRMHKKKIYALVIGGFHAKDLIKQFEAKKISILSIIPKFQIRQEPSPYFEVLREKWGDGSTWFRTTRLHMGDSPEAANLESAT